MVSEKEVEAAMSGWQRALIDAHDEPVYERRRRCIRAALEAAARVREEDGAGEPVATHPVPQPSGPVNALPEDDEPKTWQELAEAAIADLRRYVNDEMPERRLVSVEAYAERAARLSALTLKESENGE